MVWSARETSSGVHSTVKVRRGRAGHGIGSGVAVMGRVVGSMVLAGGTGTGWLVMQIGLDRDWWRVSVNSN